MNLLAHRIVDIIFEEGARFSVSEEDGGRERVEEVLAQTLKEKGFKPGKVTIEDFRRLYHDGWNEVLDRVVPSDTRTRVTDRFYQLVFS